MKLFATAATILIVAVGTATAGTGPSAQGLRADALPWPATNGHYVQAVKAYGPRFNAMVRFSAKPTPAVTAGNSAQGLRADALPWPSTNGHYVQGVKAYGPRFNAMARFSANPTPAVTAGNGFNWGDAGIGAAAGLMLAVFAGAAIVFVRNSRRTKLAL